MPTSTPPHKHNLTLGDSGISIILPVYNCEETIKRCIESVFKQTHKEWELIIIDDGSTDKTLALAQEATSDNPRVTVITQDNAGVSAARNAGLKQSRGEYVTFIDGDDWWEPEFLESLISHAGADIIIGGFKDWRTQKTCNLTEENFTHQSGIREYIAKHILGNYAAVCWGKLYSRHAIEANDATFNPSLRLAEDAVFNFTLLEHVESIITVPHTGYVYTSNPSSAKYLLSYDEFATLFNALQNVYLRLERQYDITISRHSASWLLNFHSIEGGVTDSSDDPYLTLYRITHPDASFVDLLNDDMCSPVVRLLLAARQSYMDGQAAEGRKVLRHIKTGYGQYLGAIHCKYSSLQRIISLLSSSLMITDCWLKTESYIRRKLR
ncbi:MAG: hypothetical protein C7K11_08335 [Candidatus Amulumruptor caecigallinarius]|nr:MAG: hypothetical protein C7K11_08335 [Candidatus Amulumruptor caecigallinarius]